MHNAKLIWITPNAEELLCYIARVSNPDGQDKAPGSLISYMIKHGHWSPFEMVNMCVEINTTRTIGRQFLRHSHKVQEFSQRYEEPNKLGEFVFSEARIQDEKNRQASHATDNIELNNWWQEQQIELEHYIKQLYENARKMGIAKELARNVLPEGMTPTRMYFNGNLRDWLFLINLRTGHGTQSEATLVANSLYEITMKEFPITGFEFFSLNQTTNQS